MVIRKKGSVFFIDGKEFKIGGGVFANDESEYMGLYGTVTEIRTDEDRETESGAFNVPKKATAQGVVVAVFYSTVGSQSNRNNSGAEK